MSDHFCGNPVVYAAGPVVGCGWMAVGQTLYNSWGIGRPANRFGVTQASAVSSVGPEVSVREPPNGGRVSAAERRCGNLGGGRGKGVRSTLLGSHLRRWCSVTVVPNGASPPVTILDFRVRSGCWPRLS